MEYQYTKIRENIWQIGEDDVCCTLIRGSRLAVLMDTAYGGGDLRAFVEANVTTPYIVINSHGHPDHMLGNFRFDCAYIAPEDMDVLHHFDDGAQKSCPLKELNPGTVLDLGNLHVEVVSLAGHTKGSIGLLVWEERLLAAGDGLNDQLWLFNYGSLTIEELYATLQRVLELPFDTYLGGHGDREYTKDLIRDHIHNIENLQVLDAQRKDIFGFDTYTSVYESSMIVYTTEKLEGLRFRKAAPDDLKDLVDLALELWPGHTARGLSAELAEILVKEDAAFFLAYDSGTPVGFAQCQLRRDYVEGAENSPVGYLEGIFVSETHRKQGIAKELLAACEDWAREKGCTEFASDCELTNIQSLQFHLNVGFKEVNRIICFTKKL